MYSVRLKSEKNAPLAIYIHWPFCESKCPYCDFNSYALGQREETQKAWQEAIGTELEYMASLTGRRDVASVFFGGGTPSLMKPETVAYVMNKIAELWHLPKEAEVTMEANPASSDAVNFAGYKAAGVNRLSIGVQSFDDKNLQFLGRRHSSVEAIASIKNAAKLFEQFSFDLIYALPSQSLDDWQRELGTALQFAPRHLSAYQLTIEEGTKFHSLAGIGKLPQIDDELAIQMYELTQEVLGAAGLPAYEVSNHAAPGHECQHNLNYWRYGEYIGLGPGAHGRIVIDGEKYATQCEKNPKKWLNTYNTPVMPPKPELRHSRLRGNDGNRIGNFQDSGIEFTKLSPCERAIELIMMGMRLREGIALDDISRESSLAFDQVIDMKKVEQLASAGFLKYEPEKRHLHPTFTGLQRLNAVVEEIIR